MDVVVLVGSFWVLVGIIILVTGKASINDGWKVLTGRKARIFGVITILLGIAVLLRGIYVGGAPALFSGGGLEVNGFFLYFVAVALLATAITTVQLVRWAKNDDRADEVRKRTLIVVVSLTFQLAFFFFVGKMLLSS